MSSAAMEEERKNESFGHMSQIVIQPRRSAPSQLRSHATTGPSSEITRGSLVQSSQNDWRFPKRLRSLSRRKYGQLNLPIKDSHAKTIGRHTHAKQWHRSTAYSLAMTISFYAPARHMQINAHAGYEGPSER